MTYLLPFFNLACSAETQIKEKKIRTKITQASHFTFTHTQNISFSQTHTHKYTQTVTFTLNTLTQTNETSHFKGITHLITTPSPASACIIQRKKEKERERKFIVVNK